jgi:DUF4097 and DUF4098 domain-containing protein YvlB
MRTKIIAALLAVLTALGGLNLFKSIKERLFPDPASTTTAVIQEKQAETTDGRERIRIRVGSAEAEKEQIRERATIQVRRDGDAAIDRRFNVRDGQTLFIDVQHADVDVETGSSSEAHVRVSYRASNEARAREVFDAMNFRVNMVGDEVRVESDAIRGNWNSDRNGGLDINVDVTIPERFNAHMTTTHGDVELADIEGTIYLNTTHGDVEAGTIRGPEITLRSTHGDIEADELQSDTITLNTTHADIEVESVTGHAFSAKTSHSDIQIGRLAAASDIETSHGDIAVSMTSAYNTSLTTSHGDVVLYAPSNLNADLDLRAAQVRVASPFHLNGSVKKDEVDARVGSGGVRIVARTTHGSVDVKNR